VTAAGYEPMFILGTAQLGTEYGITRHRLGAPNTDEPRAFLAAALNLGVNTLDTAPAYGHAEEIIGEAEWRGGVHTKVSRGVDPLTSAERSLEVLSRNAVELLYLHDPAVVLDPTAPLLAAAYDLVGTLVGVLGASVYEEAEFDAALLDDRIGAVQVPCNVLDRRFSGDRLSAAVSAGMHVYVRSALLQGVLAMPPEELPRHLGELGTHVAAFHSLCHDIGRSPLDVALAWVRSLSGVRGVIVGASSAIELQALLAAYRSEPLTDTELDRLGELPTPAKRLTDPRNWSATS